MKPKNQKIQKKIQTLGLSTAELHSELCIVCWHKHPFFLFQDHRKDFTLLKPDSIRGKTKPAVLSSHSGSLPLAANGTQTHRNIQEKNNLKCHKSIPESEHWMLGKSFQERRFCADRVKDRDSQVCCREVTCVWFYLPSRWGVCPELISSLFLLDPSKNSSRNMVRKIHGWITERKSVKHWTKQWLEFT